jgi:hypothetical protein
VHVDVIRVSFWMMVFMKFCTSKQGYRTVPSRRNSKF